MSWQQKTIGGETVWTNGEATAWLEDDGTLAVGDAEGVAVGYLSMETISKITGLNMTPRKGRRRRG